jgi:hypothetical protein
MRLWRPSQIDTVLQSESNFLKHVGFSLSFLRRKVTWCHCGKMWGGLGFGPQSTYLVLHALHRQSILSLIQVSTSANEIEQTSWCTINSSNVLNILMIKNHFTFESKVTNKVVSELVISTSPPPLMAANHPWFGVMIGAAV